MSFTSHKNVSTSGTAFFYDVGRDAAASFNSRVETRRLKSAQKRHGVRLQKRLAAREGNAAGITVKRRVARYGFDDVAYSHRLTRDLQSARGAGVRAYTAGDTFISVDLMLISKRMRAARTYGTRAAADALFLIEKQLLRGFFAFRVVAPDAVKRTAFQEYGRAEPRSVVHTEPLYLRDRQFNSCIRIHSDLSPYPAILC